MTAAHANGLVRDGAHGTPVSAAGLSSHLTPFGVITQDFLQRSRGPSDGKCVIPPPVPALSRRNPCRKARFSLASRARAWYNYR